MDSRLGHAFKRAIRHRLQKLMKLEGDLDDPQVSEGSDNEGDELVKGYNFNLFHFIDQ